MATPRLLLLLPALLGGCLERDIATALMYLSDSSSSDTGTTAAADSTTDPPLHTATGRESSTTDTDTSTSDLSDTSTTEPTATSTGESTAAPPVCGDGVVEGDEEECDAPEDLEELTCTSTCARPRLAFITSETFTGKDINGVKGADARCHLAAAAAGIPDSLNYKAIISDSTTSAAERLLHSRGPYRLINGLQLARDFEALMNEPLENHFDTTELGTDGYPGAWTGTALGGGAVPGGHCEDWHSSSFQDYGSWGSPTQLDGQWLEVSNDLVNPSDCGEHQALYCLEQE